jgi:hypothetical protein
VEIQNIDISNDKTELDMIQLRSGIYFPNIFDREHGVKKDEKIIKQ